MDILADESVDGQIVQKLRSAGHLVTYIAEAEPGIIDERVFELANSQKALLLTADKDFGEIVYRQNKLSSGVVLLRLAGVDSSSKADYVLRAFELHGEALTRAFSVISPYAVRIRMID
ncbi:MAG: hypothetical protein DCC75_01370 [Proteobacteria bacterium]|nr:MAG: hypothetical protein DCC75_01370 [Pseudomonadota bacterium]